MVKILEILVAVMAWIGLDVCEMTVPGAIYWIVVFVLGNLIAFMCLMLAVNSHVKDYETYLLTYFRSYKNRMQAFCAIFLLIIIMITLSDFTNNMV